MLHGAGGEGSIMSSHTDTTDAINNARHGSASDQTLLEVLDTLRGLQFGSVTLTVHDGVVVQIDRMEKRRLKRASSARQT